MSYRLLRPVNRTSAFVHSFFALALIGLAGSLSATDYATFRTRAVKAAKSVRPDLESASLPLIEAIVAGASTDEELATLSKSHGDEVAAAVLAEALQLDQEDARIAAAEKLEELGFASRTVVPALIGALRDKNEYVRNYAATALGNIGPEAQAAVPALTSAGTPHGLWRLLIQRERSPSRPYSKH
jgi:HEAT repeat protein